MATRKPPIGDTVGSVWANSGTAPAGTSGTGTITSSGSMVTGTGTSFTTELFPGDYIVGATALEAVKVLNIHSDTLLQLDQAPVTTISAEAFTIARAEFSSIQITNIHATNAATVNGSSLAAGTSTGHIVATGNKRIAPIVYNKGTAELRFSIEY